MSIAEVVRDLYRASDQPEQSYSERQLYESALDRMARELAAVEKIDRDKAMEKLALSLANKKAVTAAA
jgi:CarD family transcriptional regulator